MHRQKSKTPSVFNLLMLIKTFQQKIDEKTEDMESIKNALSSDDSLKDLEAAAKILQKQNNIFNMLQNSEDLQKDREAINAIYNKLRIKEALSDANHVNYQSCVESYILRTMLTECWGGFASIYMFGRITQSNTIVFYNNSVPSVFPFSNENEITAYTAVLASVSGKTHFVTHLKGYKEDMGRIIKETFSENVILISGKTISTQTLVKCATRLSY